MCRNLRCLRDTSISYLLDVPHRFKLKLDDGKEDSDALIRSKAFERGVLALPGTVFYPNKRTTAYVRASFSIIEEHDMDEALKRLKEAIIQARDA